MLKLIPCPRCRKLCRPDTESCESCGCPVRKITERQQKQVKVVVVVIVLIFLLLLANSIYWATKL